MAEEAIKALKSKRGSVKARVTRFTTFFRNPANRAKGAEIRKRLQGLDTCLQQYEDYHCQIQALDESQATDAELSAFEDEYYSVISEAENMLAISLGPPASTSPTPQNSGALPEANMLHVKLPDINLPTFNGLFTEWVSFRDSFKSLIHNNISLNPIQKFHYLKGSVKGEARNTISHLTPSEANYQSAWALLEDRYENTRLITQHHVRALFSLPSVAHKDSKSLRSLLHTVTSNIKALEAIQRPVNTWDDLLIHLIASKFDANTTMAWEGTLKNELPTFQEMTTFLVQRCNMWESLEANSVSNKVNPQIKLNKQQNTNFNTRTASHFTNSSENQPKCPICTHDHNIFNCATLLELNTEQRRNEIKAKRLCFNCLKSGHRVESCRAGKCRKCNKKHNTLLHMETEITQNEPASQAPPPNSVATTSANCAQVVFKNVSLSTAIVIASGKNGKLIQLRALLDSGSVSNFITQRAINQLNIDNIQKIALSVTGIGCNSSSISQAAKIEISATTTSFKTKLNFLIVPEITGNIPIASFSELHNIPKNVQLADPLYYQSRPVDLLIGNEIFWNIICIGQIHLHKQGPVLQKTQFGWIFSGVVPSAPIKQKTICNLSNNSLDNQLRAFWEIEQFKENDNSPTSDPCEKHFRATFSRDPSGRFMVKLPFINEPPLIGNSQEKVLQMFYNLEKRIQKKPSLQAQYTDFMTTYLLLGHMSETPHPDNSGYFLPHHGVINDHSSTTRLRVVFNASFKTSNGQSINDNLFSGPNLQQELFSILVRFRLHKIIITADLKQMFRQILLHNDHRKYQQIFWRESPNEDLKTFQLNTVTYGFTCSSYLAARCLQELANSETFDYPQASQVILKDMYVDDIISGADSIQEAQKLLRDLTSIFAKGGFELHKITSNQALTAVNAQSQDITDISLDKQNTIKTLGVFWNHNSDIIKYSTYLDKPNQNKKFKITKRGILSTIARIFDPLGLVAPVTVTAKIILQKLWSLKINWDESVPGDIYTLWTEFIKTFSYLDNISIPRRAISSTDIEVHGFCDASQNAYGACIYLRSKDLDGMYQTHLLCSKNRVAPLKVLTIPRLELCGALLLAELMNKLLQTLDIPTKQVYYWCDSTIVLSWLRLPSSTLKTFVANRVSKIQSITSPDDWFHIPTNENPADLLTRGINAVKLCHSDLWWNGPGFLRQENIEIKLSGNHNLPTYSDVSEIKSNCHVSNNRPPGAKFELLSRYSSFSKLIRVTAFMLRFIHNTRYKNDKRTDTLTCSELNNAHHIILKLTQTEAFPDDINHINKHGEVRPNSKIRNLNPFLDQSGLLRVGGRLKHAHLSNEQKHQLLLPKNHHVTELVIKMYHHNNLHSGCQATLSAIRERYWPVAAKNSIRKIIFNCLNCYRVTPITYNQLMADLPKTRVTATRPFSATGIDYAGPITLKNGHGRTTKTIKGYIVVFVCFCTRAVHIDLVAECTSSTFLNALKRFISRRGKPTHIYSDNAKNFIGANRHLQELVKLFETKEFQNTVVNNLTNQGITWHFIPPRAPHMGGLWEAAVKSVKHHLKRVLGDTLLNFEEMTTLLTMIEACLNSRPLTPISNDPNDFTALTPGHFLIGGPLTAPAELDATQGPSNRLTRYQLLERLRQTFWKRWSQEYLHQFQQRSKWNSNSNQQPKPGDLVLIKEDNTAPQTWPLGRITETHPGADGRIRVVSVKTVRGVFKRPITKICAVPGDNNN